MALEFHVIWAIDVEADSAEEAAHQARAIQLTPGMSATLFDVWAHAAVRMRRIDLIEEPGKLNGDELAAIRTGLRWILCNPDTSTNIEVLATVLLIFLDKDRIISQRRRRGPSR
jgi:hypothetical protein